MPPKAISQRSIMNYLADSVENDEKSQESESSVSDNTGSGDNTSGTITRGNSMVVSEIKKLRKEMKEGFKKVHTEMKGLRESVEYAHQEIGDLKKSKEDLKTGVESLEKKWGTMEKTVKEHEEKLNATERYSREYNIRVAGIKEEKDENCAVKIVNLLHKHKALNSSKENLLQAIEVAHRVGPFAASASASRTQSASEPEAAANQPRSGPRPRQIIVKLRSKATRNMIIKDMKDKKDDSGKRFVYEDLTKTDYKAKKNANEIMKKAYEDGKRCRFVRGKLIIEGQVVDIPP